MDGHQPRAPKRTPEQEANLQRHLRHQKSLRRERGYVVDAIRRAVGRTVRIFPIAFLWGRFILGLILTAYGWRWAHSSLTLPNVNLFGWLVFYLGILVLLFSLTGVIARRLKWKTLDDVLSRKGKARPSDTDDSFTERPGKTKN